MFQTTSSAEVHVPKSLAPSSERLWSWASLPIHIPFYFVSMSVQTESGIFDRMIFVSMLEQLDEIARACGAAQLTSVMLVSPKWLNGGGDWQMEPLREILRGRDTGGGLRMVYVPENGKRYVDTELGVSAEKLSEVETVFSVRTRSHLARC